MLRMKSFIFIGSGCLMVKGRYSPGICMCNSMGERCIPYALSQKDFNLEYMGSTTSSLHLSSWIATGCEDRTVRLTRYMPGVENWSASKLLREHVGGSAVRSICSVSKISIVPSDVTNLPDMRNGQNAAMENIETPGSLISVGAKRVLTSWLLRRKVDKKEEQHNITGNSNKYFKRIH